MYRVRQYVLGTVEPALVTVFRSKDVVMTLLLQRVWGTFNHRSLKFDFYAHSFPRA